MSTQESSAGDSIYGEENAGLLTSFTRRRLRIATLLEYFALLVVAASLVGLIIYILTINSMTTFVSLTHLQVFFRLPGPFYIYGTGVGIWLCTLLIFFSIQLLHNSRKRQKDVEVAYWLQLVYHGLILVASFIITICYALGGRTEGYAWGIILIVIQICNVMLLLIRHFSAPQMDSDTITGPYYGGMWCFPGNSKELKHPRVCYTLSVWNIVNCCLTVFFVVLLCGGAVIQSYGAFFPLKGAFATYTLPDGTNRTQTIRYICEGPKTNKPVIIVDADAAHGATDFYGVQKYLVEGGRRVCIFDKPGLGLSDYLYADQSLHFDTFYHQMLMSMEEPRPWTLVGWGGGAEYVWDYANAHPENVDSLVFLDAYAGSIEQRLAQYMRNLTLAEMIQQRDTDTAFRSMLFDAIRGLAVPWGISGVFVPYQPEGYEPPEAYDEYRWTYMVDKTWTTQYYYMKTILGGGNVTLTFAESVHPTNPVLMGRLPILHLMTNLSSVDLCGNMNYEMSSPECAEELKKNEFMKMDQILLANMTGLPSFAYCNWSDCSQSFPIRKPQWVAQSIIQRFG